MIQQPEMQSDLNDFLSKKTTDGELRDVAMILAALYPGKIKHLEMLVRRQANNRLDVADLEGFQNWKRLSVAILAAKPRTRPAE